MICALKTSPLIYFVYKLNCFPNLCHTLGVTVCVCVCMYIYVCIAM